MPKPKQPGPSSREGGFVQRPETPPGAMTGMPGPRSNRPLTPGAPGQPGLKSLEELRRKSKE